jgi:Fe2+ or Zn2+ uptake regulation protein
MLQKKYHVSKATIYNTIEIFLDAGLIRKHQFGEKHSLLPLTKNLILINSTII